MRVEESLKRFVPSGIRSRGEDYYLRNRVVSVRAEGGTILCSVRGSEIYRVALTPDRQELSTSCSCPYFVDQGQTCKHIWAAIRESSVRELLSGEFRSLSHGGTVVPFRPAVKTKERTAKWRSFFDALPTFRERLSSRVASPVPEEILYVIEGSANRVPAWSVNLAIRGRSRKKNGDWGQPKRLSMDLAHLDAVDPFDRDTILLLHLQGSSGSVESEHHLRPASAAPMIEKLARADRLWLDSPQGGLSLLRWDDGPAWSLVIEVRREESGNYRLAGSFTREEAVMALDAAELIIPGILVSGQSVSKLEQTDALDWVEPLLKAGSVEIPAEERDALVKRLLHAPAAIRLPEDLATEETSVVAEPIIRLSRADENAGDLFEARVVFRYRDREVEFDDHSKAWMDGRQIIRRDIDRERSSVQRLSQFGFVKTYNLGFTIRSGLLGPALESLIRHGWRVEIDQKRVRGADETRTEISTGIDWFDLGGGARFGDQTVSLPELLTAIERRRPVIALADGSLGIVPEQWISQFSSIAQIAERTEGVLRFRNQQAVLIDALLEARATEVDRAFSLQRERIVGAQTAGPATESETFRGRLRPYQQEGLGWLLYLRDAGVGGCHADDMGLGKTVQVLALLDRIGSSERPTLVVAPRSLLFNWKKEAERFTPNLRVLEHHGNERARGTEHFAEYDLILTTYATMRLDIAQLSQVDFEYAILDEAQAIKNASSQIARSVRLLRSRHRLALSGTPIENHIGELWSLFEFLIPGMLGPARWFQRTFAAKNVTPEKRRLLGNVLRPLILRRTKEQVAPELPSRIEQTLYCELEPEERQQYEELRQFYRASLLETIREKGFDGSKMHVLEALLRLRQAACHPALLGREWDGPSSKLQLLIDELDEVVESGHRALIFSQFTSLLALVRKELDRAGLSYAYLDGTTRNREEVVEQFQSDAGPPVFLISLKAGGVGLNLTAADYVFLLDPWWNPAVEAQAIDRTHRIGQEKPVVAYRLIARDTVEEKILELQAAKRDLASSVITDENSVLQTLDAEQLERLLE